MRVTENTNFDTIRESIQRSKGRMEKLQTQSSTLRKLNAPSDDPVGAAKLLEIRTDKVNTDQFLNNSKLAESVLEASDHALADVSELLIRAKEIAISQSSGASANDETRLGVAEEVAQLFRQAVGSANWKVGERYLFGGYKTQKPPIGPEGEYRGDDGTSMIEVGKDIFIAVNVPGFEVFNTQPEAVRKDVLSVNGQRVPATLIEDGEGVIPRQNTNLFRELQNLRIALLTGDMDGIRSTLDGLDALHTQITASRSKLGSRLSGLKSTQQALERQTLTQAELGAHLEDADMAQVVSDLAKEETVFRSALSSSQKLIQPTLLDFIR